jgi:peptide/nickel transport system substrate-binding protein
MMLAPSTGQGSRRLRPRGAEGQPGLAVSTWACDLRALVVLSALALILPLFSCANTPDPKTLVMIIESSPTNLDPRVGLDAQSERIDNLIFDDLLSRGDDLSVAPGLADQWETPDPLTYVFHLHHGVRFHDGRPLTARDVKWTFDSLLQGKIRSAKAAAFRFVDHLDAADDFTIVFHMKEPDAGLLWNVSDGAIGVVPYNSGDEVSRTPIGSGPFKFVSAEPDKEVVLERNDDYWCEKPKLARVRFAVVPDATTQALELRKGSGDVVINASFPPDTVLTLKREPSLAISSAPGTRLAYLGFNLRDPILKDVRVRQAVAYALDRRPMIDYLWRGEAQPARSVLPPQSWAYEGNVPPYDHSPDKARELLDAAGYPAVNGVRFHIAMKTSTDENTRLMVAVMQQQLREVGIALDIRSFEFGTFFSDVTHGAFQLYGLRWIGGNEDPDIFYVFHSSRFPPNGANRGFYSNPKVDTVIDQARREVDPAKRKQLYAEVQRIVANELPYINLWYLDNVLVHNRRVVNLKLNPAGNYDFLRTAELVQGK